MGNRFWNIWWSEIADNELICTRGSGTMAWDQFMQFWSRIVTRLPSKNQVTNYAYIYLYIFSIIWKKKQYPETCLNIGQLYNYNFLVIIISRRIYISQYKLPASLMRITLNSRNSLFSIGALSIINFPSPTYEILNFERAIYRFHIPQFRSRIFHPVNVTREPDE